MEIATSFLRLAATHLMFIDADIGFVAQDVLARLAFPSIEQVDVIAGAYPHKQIAWEQLTRAVAAGITDPARLSVLTSLLVFNPLDRAAGKVPLGVPLEVAEVATGFVLGKHPGTSLVLSLRQLLRYAPVFTGASAWATRQHSAGGIWPRGATAV